MRAQQYALGTKSKTLTFEGVLCWVPLAAYFCLFVFTAIAVVKTGHWPDYGRPDPKNLQFPLLHGAALWGYPVTIIAAVVGLIGLACQPERWERQQAWIFALGVALWGISIGPVIQLFVWLID